MTAPPKRQTTFVPPNPAVAKPAPYQRSEQATPAAAQPKSTAEMSAEEKNVVAIIDAVVNDLTMKAQGSWKKKS